MKLLVITGALALAVGACGPITYWPKTDQPTLDDREIQPEEARAPTRARADSRRSRRWRTVGNAAAVGFVLGGLLGANACDDLHETDGECEDRTLDSALIGGAIGAAIGAAVAP